MKILRLEPTPNPNALKFIVNSKLSSRPHSYRKDSAPPDLNDPLANELFSVSGIREVFYLSDFITVVKDEESDWNQVMIQAGKKIQEFDPALLEPLQTEEPPLSEEEDELLSKVRKLLEEQIFPILQRDGGGLEIVSLEGKNIFIRYHGACGSCPHSTMQTLFAIQNLVQQRIDPELKVIPA